MIVEGKGEKRREKDMGEHMDIMIMQNGTHQQIYLELLLFLLWIAN